MAAALSLAAMAGLDLANALATWLNLMASDQASSLLSSGLFHAKLLLNIFIERGHSIRNMGAMSNSGSMYVGFACKVCTNPIYCTFLDSSITPYLTSRTSIPSFLLIPQISGHYPLKNKWTFRQALCWLCPSSSSGIGASRRHFTSAMKPGELQFTARIPFTDFLYECTQASRIWKPSPLSHPL